MAGPKAPSMYTARHYRCERVDCLVDTVTLTLDKSRRHYIPVLCPGCQRPLTPAPTPKDVVDGTAYCRHQARS